MEISEFREKRQIPLLGFKFHDPWKTVGPTYILSELLVHV